MRRFFYALAWRRELLFFCVNSGLYLGEAKLPVNTVLQERFPYCSKGRKERFRLPFARWRSWLLPLLSVENIAETLATAEGEGFR